MPNDDDPTDDWADAEKTAVQDVEAIPELIPDGMETVAPSQGARGPHVTGPVPASTLPGYDVGFRAGAANAEGEYRRGVLTGRQEVFDALRLAYRSLDIASDLPAHLEAWVRRRLPPA